MTGDERVTGDERADGTTAELPEAGPTHAPRRRRSRGGVSVVAGGLLQDLEDRMRRDLPPIEEWVRSGEETRGVAGGQAGPAGTDDPLVIVLPATQVAERDRG